MRIMILSASLRGRPAVFPSARSVPYRALAGFIRMKITGSRGRVISAGRMKPQRQPIHWQARPVSPQAPKCPTARVRLSQKCARSCSFPSR